MWLVAVSLLSACDSNPYGPYCSQVPSDNFPGSHPSPPSQGSSSNPNIDYAWLGTVVPGCFGGLYLTPVNGKDVLVIELVDTIQFGSAVDAIRTYEPAILTNYGANGVLSHHVKWGWLQLYEWSNFVPSHYTRWTVLGIDGQANNVRMGVASRADSIAAVSAFDSWGAPPDLYTVVIAGNFCDCTGASTCC